MTPEQMRKTVSSVATNPDGGDRIARLHDFALQLCGVIDSLTVQRDAAEALSREQSARACAAEIVTASARLAVQALIGVALDCQTRWSRGHESIVESAKDMMYSTASINGRWVPRVDFDAVVDGEINARADRDAAQQLVAEMRGALSLAQVEVSLDRSWCRICRTDGRGAYRGRDVHPHAPSCLIHLSAPIAGRAPINNA